MKAAKYNKKILKTPIFILTDEETATKQLEKKNHQGFASTFVDIGQVLVGKYPRLRKRFIAIFGVMFISYGLTYGLTLNTGNFGGSFYLNFILIALVEIPAVGLTILLSVKFDIGRRWILTVAYFLCGTLNLIIALLQGIGNDVFIERWNTLIITLAMGGKFAIAGAYAVLQLFTAEQFPTVIKNSGLGYKSNFSFRI